LLILFKITIDNVWDLFFETRRTNVACWLFRWVRIRQQTSAEGCQQQTPQQIC